MGILLVLWYPIGMSTESEEKAVYSAHTPEKAVGVDRGERHRSVEGLETVCVDGAFVGRAGWPGGKTNVGGS